MTMPSHEDPLWRIYTTLVKYPILRARIRSRMRQELFRRGVITPQDFEARVREEAILSQQREGVPRYGDPEDVWQTRRDRIRAYLTDVYFAIHLPLELFEQIVKEVLAEKHPQVLDLDITFNPEVAPFGTLIEYASMYAQMPPEERQKRKAHIQEIKAALIRRIISDQLAYVSIARQWLELEDLLYIANRKIGPGKIGGKAAGVILAYRVLKNHPDPDLREHVDIPESYFIGADVIYAFMSYNDLMKWADQKYKPPEQIQEEYPILREEFLRGRFPPDIEDELRQLLEKIGPHPIIVRSSSLLEDNFGMSFAGKYESHFLPNQAEDLEARLRTLVRAIASIYASALSLEPLLYRRERNLLDYDERLAILVQYVVGEPHGSLYYPQAAGVAFSHNLFRWSPKIRMEDGFVRMVWGLGTRAVERVGEDYPRLIALSHPHLRPEATAKEIRRYSQHFIDVLNLQGEGLETHRVHDLVENRNPILRFVFSIDQGGYLAPLHATFIPKARIKDLVVTFDEWLRRTPFVDRMKRILKRLSEVYGVPVDVEFAARIPNPTDSQPEMDITILQCRPQSHYQEEPVHIPEGLKPEDIVLESWGMVPHGKVEGIAYVLFVTPEGYRKLSTSGQRRALIDAIRRLNERLQGEVFICVGPGRWGTRNPELGVQVGFADIYNARALIELASMRYGIGGEPSFGTHFFQDLIEARIYPLAVDLDDERTRFDRAFFYESPSMLFQMDPQAEPYLEEVLRVIPVSRVRPGQSLALLMNADQGHAVMFWQEDKAGPGGKA